jgi:hypothetical protein
VNCWNIRTTGLFLFAYFLLSSSPPLSTSTWQQQSQFKKDFWRFPKLFSEFAGWELLPSG